MALWLSLVVLIHGSGGWVEKDSGEKYLQKYLELRDTWEQFGLHSKQAGHAEG